MADLPFLNLDKYLLDQNSKIIHKIWFGIIPNKKEAKKAYEKLKIYRDSWKIQNPTWCHIEWNKDMCTDLIKNFYPEHENLFKKYKYEIQRCDMARYLILHRYGGFYSDMDYFCNKPFDQVINIFQNDIYLVQTPNTLIEKEHVSNSLMFSKKNHPFWKQLLISMEKSQNVPYYYSRHIEVMFTTGPGILNRVYSKYKYRYKVKSYPYELFHPFGIGDDKRLLNGNNKVYAIHIGKGSWEENDSKYLLFFYTEWKVVLFIILVLILPKIIYKIIEIKKC
jgi:mannosyltransferase OCH1-like enzyme